MRSVVVAVDAMGGDNAPAVEVAAAVEAARRWGMTIILVGDAERIAQQLQHHAIEGLPLQIQHASEVVTMEDAASDSVRKKKDSSIRVAFELVRQNQAHAAVSAGNSGATMACGKFAVL